MSETRVFGRDTTLRLIQDGQLITEVTAIRSWTFDVNVKRVEEHYLGETAARQDEIFESVSGNIPFHVEGPSALKLQKAIADRATKRSNPQPQFDISLRIAFPSGVVARINVADIKFDPIPLNQSGRENYLEMTLNWKAPKYTLNAG